MKRIQVLIGLVATVFVCVAPVSGWSPWQEIPTEVAAQPDPQTVEGDTAADAGSGEQEVLAGHSYHGDAFNEGPRQAAYLMQGTGQVHFPVTSEHPEVQSFIDQGVGQLHGFWYLEAERSFRQAATLDPNCAVAYWGMAMANTNNEKRAKDFIKEAMDKKESASEREKKYIEALSKYLNSEAKEEKDKRQKGLDYIGALENIVLDYPDDLEAKAFLALALWDGRRDSLPIMSFHATSALLDEIFAQQPQHPAHHYKIHLWDYKKPEKALEDAAWCGPSAPGIAHMWHMPGHIYSRLKRYEDAAWQQEASARVDHAHMMRDHLIPDEIHNFAHNNEWLIRNLIFVGRVDDALDLAKNMSELPRHPRYNELSKRGSANYGRQRLFDVLWQYRLWDEVVTLENTPYLEPTDKEDEQVNRLKLVGAAHAALGNTERADAGLADIEQRLGTLESEQTAAVDKAIAEFEAKQQQPADAAEQPATTDATSEQTSTPATEETATVGQEDADQEKAEAKAKEELEAGLKKAREDAARPFGSRRKRLEQARDVIQGFQALQQGDAVAAWEKIKSDSDQDKAWIAELQFLAGERDQAIESLQSQVKQRENEVIPLATLSFLLDQAGKPEEADACFQQLRQTSYSLDIERSLFARLQPLAERAGLESDWRLPPALAQDLGPRPVLDELGPFRWQPSAAQPWTLVDAAGEQRSLSEFRGKPVVVIFYLGYGCLHCVEQLQAFAPKMQEFSDAGISMIAISTDDQEGLIQGLKDFDGEMPIPLVANPDFSIFKKYRCFDDFENQPLHGTFLIDGEGLVRWQDISYEPFMDHEFLLTESLRLLAQPSVTDNGATGEISTLIED